MPTKFHPTLAQRREIRKYLDELYDDKTPPTLFIVGLASRCMYLGVKYEMHPDASPEEDLIDLMRTFGYEERNFEIVKIF
ncbi:MAG TPA: hypothetical protein VIM77_10340 [Mucilaginibacter sp.]